MGSMSSTGMSLELRERLMDSDLKPENILLDYTGHIALCDFGLCKLNMSNEDTTNSTSPLCCSTDYSFLWYTRIPRSGTTLWSWIH
jgi:hypothetical protein